MNDRTRVIFGISPGVRDEDQHHVFINVLAEVIDGKLRSVSNPKSEFPNVGNVYVSADNWIPADGVGAIWQVRSTRAVEVGARQAEYSAVDVGRPLPLELIALSLSADSPDAVHRALVEGIELSYTPANTALIRLADGVVIGPVRRDPLSVERSFRCKPDSLNEPLGYWKDGGAVSPISFQMRGERRTFASLLTLPPPEAYYDCADIEHAVRVILRLSRDTLGNSGDVFNKQLNTLARVVVELSVPAKLESRLARVRRVMAGSELGQPLLKAFSDYIASQPSVQAELVVLKAEARKTEQQRVADEQKALTKQIAEMKKSKAQLDGELSVLRTKIAEAEGQFTIVLDQVAKNISERVEKLRREPAAMLADIALIRPFLSEVPPSQQPIEESPVQFLKRPAEILQPQNFADLLSSLERSFAAAGLVGGSAKRLSREVMAAAQASQLVSFSGSLASVLARACAGAFAAASASSYRVPVGLLDGEELGAVLSSLLLKIKTTSCLSALILEGTNRSAFEAYADDLRALIAESQLNPQSAAPGLIVIATLVRGPSALSPSPAQSELGPIFDTDTLSLASREVVVSSPGGRVTLSDWQKWRAEAITADTTADDYQDLRRAMEGEESILWRRMLRNVYGRLRAINDGTSSTPIESLAFGWLIPRAHSCDVPKVRFLDELSSELLGEEQADPRLKRLVTKLFPVDDALDESQA